MQSIKQPSQERAAAKKHVILFLAANPSGTDRLALDREARSIHAELKRSGYRDRFRFETRWAAEPLDLLRELRELQPTVVHFSGHGSAATPGITGSARDRDVVAAAALSGSESYGLYFHDAAGRARVVSPAAIAQTFGAAGDSVRLVVLNACFTEPIAEALLAHVHCVVGMSGAIHDDAARSFSIGFYGGLGEHEPIERAFEQGKTAINLDGLPDVERPKLKVRAGFDAGQLILAAATPLLRRNLPCPYPGMRPYTADDAGGFHGREAELDELIDRLRAGEHEVYVIGPSGSGKSSLVAAGVLPRLARGVAGLGPLVVRTMRPGEHPAVRLCEALEQSTGQPFAAPDAISTLLAHRARDASVLLVVDQLEELFTLASASECAAFLAGLRALRDERRFIVIVTLRADFFGALMESALWPERARDQLSLVKVSPLRGEALREAIAVPAREVGVSVDPELIERLLADAASEPGVLPLLQETMVQLWEKRVDQTLTLADYEALGDGPRSGLAVAMARRADATLRRLSAAQAGIARRFLLRLISFGEGRSDTRRQQPRAQLRVASDDAGDFDLVLQTMVDDRLLTVDEDVAGEPRVDLAHEIMIAAWPQLAEWIRIHRVDEQRRRQLEAAATAWVEHERGVRGLLDPIELAEAEQWQRTESAARLGQSADVIALIAASRAGHTKQRRRRRAAASSAGLLGVVAIAVAAAFLAARGEAENARRAEAEARRLAADNGRLANKNLELVAQSYMESGRQLVVEERYQEAVPYLLAARQGGLDSAPLRMMFWEVEQHLPVFVLAHRDEVESAAFSPDGMRVVTASADKTARVWDAATGAPLTRPLKHQDAVWSVAFSPDGTRVVTASADKTARVWDVATGTPRTASLEHQRWVTSAAFSPDGTHVVTMSLDKTARVWDAATGAPLTRPLKHQDAVWSVAFSPDGRRVVTASRDGTARVWDAATGKPLARPLKHQSAVRSAEYSPDGACVVTASFDNTARIWDAATGKPITPPLEHQHQVQSAKYSPDGTRVVTASFDNTARIWDAATGKPITSPLKHQGSVASAAFSPDGTRVVTASSDKTARVWDAATGTPLGSPLEHQDQVKSAAFSPDGTRVVTASSDKTARVWDAAIGTSVICELEQEDMFTSPAFSPDGTRVLIVGSDNIARVWDAATCTPLGSPFEHQYEVVSVAFSPDGARVVTVGSDNTARVWDAATGKLLGSPFEHDDWVMSAAFGPDGPRVITASPDNTAQVWDAATSTPLGSPLEHQDEVVSAAFSPDGARVVTVSSDNTARVWDAATGKLLGSPFEHDDWVMSAAFGPDGPRVITASPDNTAQVWDAATSTPLGSPLEHQDEVVSAAFSPDGARVVTVSSDNTARVWDAATGTPLTLPLDHDKVVGAAFSPDGTRVITESSDNANASRVWDAATGESLSRPIELQDRVESAAFSPNGTRVVTVSSDNKTAQVWDAATGKPLGRPLEPRDRVESAAFSPDGTRVVTLSWDTAHVWDAATGKPLTSPLKVQGSVWSAAFSPDGTRVVIVSLDKTARVWDVLLHKGTLADWIRIAKRSPFVLEDGILVRRSPPRPESQPPKDRATSAPGVEEAATRATPSSQLP